MARVNILKRVKTDGQWKLLSIPRHKNGNYNWKALPDGRYFVVAVGGGFGALDQPRDPLVELAHAVLGRLPGT